MSKSTRVLLFILFALIIGQFLYSNNIAQILSFKADFYYKKNQIEKAQKYYEKAFEKGCEDSKKRSLYVNSIIESPISAVNQEKIIKFLEYDIDDVARVDAKYYIENLKQDLHKKYRGNYISNAVYNQKIIRWGNTPITYSFVNSKNVPEYFTKEIEQAFKEWEVATDGEISFVENEEDSNIIIRFKNHNPAEDSDSKYVVAYTVPITELNKLKSMEIKFYLKDVEDKYFSSNQVYNTALHEIAHALGVMGHSDNKENVMYLTKDEKSILQDEKVFLTDADINTVKLLYKIKPEITNVKNPVGDYTSLTALGTVEKINNKKIEEALTYIRKAPDLPAGYIDLAEGYLQEKRYEEAIQSLNKALFLSDTREMKAIVYYNLAVIHFYNKSYELAMENLEESISIKDSNEKQYLLAEILVKKQNVNDAIFVLNSLMLKNPQNIEYAIFLINIYLEKKDYTNARKVLKQFILENPNERDNPRFSSYKILKIGL